MEYNVLRKIVVAQYSTVLAAQNLRKLLKISQLCSMSRQNSPTSLENFK